MKNEDWVKLIFIWSIILIFILAFFVNIKLAIVWGFLTISLIIIASVPEWNQLTNPTPIKTKKPIGKYIRNLPKNKPISPPKQQTNNCGGCGTSWQINDIYCMNCGTSRKN